MLFRIQDRLLRSLFPLKPLARPLLWLGILSIPALFGVAIVRPQTTTLTLFIGLVSGLTLLLFAILVALSRAEAAPKAGLGNRLKRFWEALVFWSWVGCLLLVLGLALKIFSFSG